MMKPELMKQDLVKQNLMKPELMKMDLMSGGKQDLGLYIHWPFCASKCPYCDFNSHIAETVDHAKWAEALAREMKYMAAFSARQGDVVSSIFFGGGTPSLMLPKVMEAVLEAVRDAFSFANNTEITMEANPTSVEASRLRDFSMVGVNRLSLGMQSLDDDALRFLGREHSASEALAALDVARESFGRVSADFIYARPDQHPDDWGAELKGILGLGLDHYSLYQLTLERGTAFWSKHQRGLLDVPNHDEGRLLFDMTQDMTAEADCPAYEISNHAKEGEACRHNLIYWRAEDWLGVGPGAYGRFFKDGIRVETRARRDPASWLEDTLTNGHGLESIGQETPLDYAQESLMMGLRLKDGVDLGHIESQAGVDKPWFNEGMIQSLKADGFVDYDGQRLSLTSEGVPLLNTILSKILLEGDIA